MSKRHGQKYAVFSGTLFICCAFLFYNHGFRSGDPEAVYLLFFTCSMICLLESRYHKIWYVFFFFFASLAFLTKSFHALIIVGIGLFYYLLVGDFKKLKWWIYPVSILTYIILPGFWAILRYRFDGTKFFKAMIDDLLNRGGSQIEGHTGTIFFYFKVLGQSLAFILCTILIIYLIVMAFKNNKFKNVFKGFFKSIKNTLFNDTHSEGKLLLCWFSLVFIFYSFIIQTKLEWYIYPAVIAVSMSFPLIFIYIQKNRKTKVNKKIENGARSTTMILAIGYMVGMFVVVTVFSFNLYFDYYELQIVNLVETFNKTQVKDKKIYYEPVYWSQDAVFYVERVGLVPLEGGIDEHIKNLNSLLVLWSGTKTQYLIDHPNEYVFAENQVVCIVAN